MIPKSAIQQFLTRPRDDHRWIKAMSSDQLDTALAGIMPQPNLYPKLRKHQLACFLLGVSNPRFGFWLDMGLGKTLIALELMKYWRTTGWLWRGLVLVTSDKAYLTWEKQIKQYNIDIPYVFLQGSSLDKMEQANKLEEGLVFVHYPGLVAMLTTKQGKEWEIDEDKLAAFMQGGFEGIVLDESTKCGNHRSLTYQLVQRLSANASARYALAGRPFGRDPSLAWPQFKLLDGGETLGGTLGLYREAFCTTQRNYAARSKYAFEHKFKQSMLPTFLRLIQHNSITYGTDECPDLPPLQRTPTVEAVTLPDETSAYYQRLVDQIIAAKGNLSLMKSVFIRMRQLSSGFIGLHDDEKDERVEVEFSENPKLDRLLELIEEMPEGRQVVVFYDFTKSGRNVSSLLTQKGISNIWLWSGTKDSAVDLKRFMGGECKVAIVNNKVGAYSLDGLQVANYIIFFESPVSVIDREQAERRVLRQGQTRHVFQYDVVVRDTVDEKILDFHREGRDLYQELIANPVGLLR
jgi:SNF2 family DNA or RNA helicase